LYDYTIGCRSNAFIPVLIRALQAGEYIKS